MTGPFYGSLAASASVFVGILTALVVNNYIRIKADRRQITHRLQQVNGELSGLREQRDNFQETVNTISSKWEEEYREKAEDRVERFIESHIGSDFVKPIEGLSVDDLYRELAHFYDYDNPRDIDEDAQEPHHLNVLEEKFEDVKTEISYHVTEDFAEEYRGEGYDLLADAGSLDDSESGDEDREPSNDSIPEVVTEIGDELNRDPITHEEFINKYKQKYGFDSIEPVTQVYLSQHYKEIVDQPPSESLSGTSELLNEIGMSSDLMKSMSSPASDPQIAASGIRNINEQRQYDEAQNSVTRLESQISALEQEKEALKSQLKRANPADLHNALVANVLTIVFSVVIPMIAYMLTVVDLPIPASMWLSTIGIVAVFGFWLFGLVIAFEWLRARIKNQEPKISLFYDIANRVT